MNISEFKTEIKKATCSIANDYFNTEVKSTDAVIDLVNGYTIDIDINTHWIEDLERSIDYDVPSIDNSIFRIFYNMTEFASNPSSGNSSSETRVPGSPPLGRAFADLVAASKAVANASWVMGHDSNR